MNIDDLFSNSQNERGSQLDRAKLFIRTILANGAVEAEKIVKMAEEQGISPRTLKRAKSELGVNSVKRNDKWYWEMPIETQFVIYEQERQGSQECQPKHMVPLALLTEGVM